MKAVIDTNILIDFLQGVRKAKKELDRYQAPHISLITWMEILVGAKDEAETTLLKQFLNRFTVIPITSNIAERAVGLRRTNRIRIPDALIWAAAQEENCLLVTRNTRDFPKANPGIRIPYQISGELK